MPENLTAVRAAIDTVIDYATAHHNPPLVKALESVRHGIDAQEAQDAADYRLGYAVKDQAEAVNWYPGTDATTFGRIVRKAIESIGGRIVTGDEQPVGELIGYKIVRPTSHDEIWTSPDGLIYRVRSRERAEADAKRQHGDRLAALHLLPEAVSGEE